MGATKKPANTKLTKDLPPKKAVTGGAEPILQGHQCLVFLVGGSLTR